jgi:hypothetical protein
MIKFFRKIRQQLLTENKFSKYLVYAFGEIVLVVLGILIALQLNNQNEQRKLNLQFESNMQELYSSIKFDVERFNSIIGLRDSQIQTLQFIINYPDSLDKNDMIKALYLITGGSKSFHSETGYFLNKLNPNPENEIHNDLVRAINNYVNQLQVINELLDNRAYDMLRTQGIPAPLPEFENIHTDTIAPGYYTKKDLSNFSSLMDDPIYLSELKSLAVQIFYDKSEFIVKRSNGISLLNKIKYHYPGVRLLFQDVGIIGTSIDGFDDVGARSTPMVNTDIANSIWEIEMYLKKGLVKFRCRDSWSQNWGGDSFPEGNADYDGGNIQVTEAGNYRITLNLSENSYTFKRQE